MDDWGIGSLAQSGIFETFLGQYDTILQRKLVRSIKWLRNT